MSLVSLGVGGVSVLLYVCKRKNDISDTKKVLKVWGVAFYMSPCVTCVAMSFVSMFVDVSCLVICRSFVVFIYVAYVTYVTYVVMCYYIMFSNPQHQPQ